MTLQQLRYVVTIAEIGTISKAAEELFVSQPSLTKALKELEKENRRLKKENDFLEEASAFFAASRLKSAKTKE